MDSLVFASANAHKFEEISAALKGIIKLVSLKKIGFTEILPQTGATLESNALQKARTLYSQIKMDCFADDTGLEVEALNGEPGVHSARYAGEYARFEDNINLLLKYLEDVQNRNARFRTVFALII